MSDPINPEYYKRGGLEIIDIIEALELNHHSASALAYIARAGFKTPTPEGEAEDLEKAIWFLQRRIKLIRSAGLRVAEKRNAGRMR